MKPPLGIREMLQIYGDPRGKNGKADHKWIRDNLTTITLPYPMRLAWRTSTVVRRISCHRLIADSLIAALTDAWNYARGQVKRKYGYNLSTAEYDRLALQYLRKWGLDLFGGCYNYRLIRNGDQLSTHSWGIAIDIAPAENPLGKIGSMPLWFSLCFTRHGWMWGGTFRRRDCQHFQLCVGY